MRLSARAVINYNSVNSFSYAEEWSVREGDQNTLYFQLIDLDQDGLRYMAGIGASNTPAILTVTFPSNAAALNSFVGGNNGNIPLTNTFNFPVIDPTQVFSLVAVQADSADSSLWKVVIPSNMIPNSGNVQFSLVEGSNPAKRFSVLNLISVEPLNNGGC